MQYVVITGAERSGTTMIRKWLGENKKVKINNEFRIIEGATLLYSMIQQSKRDQDILDPTTKFLRRYIINMYKIRKWKENKILVDKHPMNTYNIDMLKFIEKAFPEVKFIYMLRDGRNVVKSARQRLWGHTIQGKKPRRRSIKQCCDIWNKVIDNTYNYMIKKKNVIIVRYEDIEKSPEKISKKICDFCNIPYDKSIPYRVKRSGADGIKVNDYKKYFNENAVQTVNIKLKNNLIKTGYIKP